MKNIHKLFLIITLNVLGCSLIAQTDSIGSKKVVMDINGNTLKIPYYSNYDLDVLNNNITEAVIVVHGANRDAYSHFVNMTTAAALRPTETDSLLVMAPQFLTDVDINFHNLDSEHLYWSSGGWKSGSLSKDVNPPRPERVSSYAVLDTIISKLTLSFPNLKSIVFTGHSAGGQLTNRYAACSSVVDNLCNQGNTYIKFIVANPSSYLYLNNLRRISGTLDQFEVPNTSCLTYNEWKYGLDNLYSYPLSAGIDSIKNMMKRKQVIYLLGENDNDPNSPSLGTSCNSTLQGDHRLERGTIYFNHLIDFYGSSILENHSIDTVPGVGHSNLDMYTSAIGLYHLFESYPVLCQNNINPPTASFTYYVSVDAIGGFPVGNDNNDGLSENTPFATIQKAADIAQAGDIVYVKMGIYQEEVVPQNSGTIGNVITFAAFPGHELQVIIDGATVAANRNVAWPYFSALFGIYGQDYIEVSGFKIQHSDAFGIIAFDANHIVIDGNYTYDTQHSGIAAWEYSSDITIINNEVELAVNGGQQECISIAKTNIFEVGNNLVHDGSSIGFGGEGIDIKQGSSNGKVYNNEIWNIPANRAAIYLDAYDMHTHDIEVYNNLIHDIDHFGMQMASELGGVLENVKVYNNIIYNNKRGAINFFDDTGYSGPEPVRFIEIYNNTFYNNGSIINWYGAITNNSTYLSDVTIKNNICANNGAYQIYNEGGASNWVVNNNLLFGDIGSEDQVRLNNGDDIQGNPLFVNVSGSDFHVQNISPSIDAGVVSFVMDDYDGTLRPIGTTYDIGAFETAAAMSCAPTIMVSDNSSICFGGSLILDAGLGYNTYAWSTGETTQSISVSTSGNYSVTTTNTNSCIASTTVGIVIPDLLVLNAIGTDATNGSNGSVNLIVIGGTAPYTYLWSNGSITEDISGLIPDIYTVIVTDDNACTEMLSITITGGECAFIAIDSQNFESGWGIWNDGGNDARRSTSDAAYANNGIYCVRLRDNTSASTITTSNMDLSGYSELMVDFSYYVVSFEGTEDFWLQISTDGGTTFTTVEDWVRGTDFNNEERHNTTITIPGPFSGTTQFRFRCDATSNADMVYVDDLNILGCPNASGYNLITTINGGGAISLSPSGGNYAAGTQVTITAVSDPGTQFNTWSGGLTGSVNPVTVTIMSNMSITANFSSLGGCSYSIVDNQNFESGWGIWNDGGNDARRSASDAAYANNGTYCIRLRNATDFSVMTTDNMDLSAYDELTVEFSYYALTFEGVEDFWLQISTDGGVTFTTKEDWIRGMDFFNEERYNTSAIISGPFSSATQLRIRCDASGSSDKVYIDDVVIKGCTTSNALITSNNGNYLEEETSQKTKGVQKNSLGDVNNLETLQINLYPNPAKDELTIVFQKEQTELIKVEIIDFTGKVIKTLMRDISNFETRQIKIDISDLHKGAYFIRVAGKVGKFIKLN